MRLHYTNSNQTGVWKYLTVEEDAPATPQDVADQLCSDAIRNGFDRLVLLEDDDGKVEEYFITHQDEPDGPPYYIHAVSARMGIDRAKDTGWNIEPTDICGNYEVEVND